MRLQRLVRLAHRLPEAEQVGEAEAAQLLCFESLLCLHPPGSSRFGWFRERTLSAALREARPARSRGPRRFDRASSRGSPRFPPRLPRADSERSSRGCPSRAVLASAMASSRSRRDQPRSRRSRRIARPSGRIGRPSSYSPLMVPSSGPASARDRVRDGVAQTPISARNKAPSTRYPPEMPGESVDVRAVLFDLDGVLVDSYQVWFHLLNGAAQRSRLSAHLPRGLPVLLGPGHRGRRREVLQPPLHRGDRDLLRRPLRRSPRASRRGAGGFPGLRDAAGALAPHGGDHQHARTRGLGHGEAGRGSPRSAGRRDRRSPAQAGPGHGAARLRAARDPGGREPWWWETRATTARPLARLEPSSPASESRATSASIGWSTFSASLRAAPGRETRVPDQSGDQGALRRPRCGPRASPGRGDPPPRRRSTDRHLLRDPAGTSQAARVVALGRAADSLPPSRPARPEERRLRCDPDRGAGEREGAPDRDPGRPPGGAEGARDLAPRERAHPPGPGGGARELRGARGGLRRRARVASGAAGKVRFLMERLGIGEEDLVDVSYEGLLG